MNHHRNLPVISVAAVVLAGWLIPGIPAPLAVVPQEEPVALPSQAEARQRAEMIHTLVHGILQVTHRDFFDSDDPDTIPSASLEEVFEELAKSHRVRLRWLGVQGKTLNIDHRPRDDFEKQAVKMLGEGARQHETTGNGLYRRAAPIRLHNTCLKCHVPDRTSLEDRVAGLVVSMPIRPE